MSYFFFEGLTPDSLGECFVPAFVTVVFALGGILTIDLLAR